jgi:hypothetical protein
MQAPVVLAPPIPSTSGASVYQQSSYDFLRDIAASLIKKLHSYLRANISRFSALKDAIPLIKRAVELYMRKEYWQAINQCFQAYVYIEALGTSLPRL